MSTEELGPRQRAAATKRNRTISATTTAARTLFDVRGWHGTTLDDIAKEVGISPAAIARYFPTKRALAIAVYAPAVQAVMESIENSPTNGLFGLPSPEDKVDEFIIRLAEVLTDHPAMAVALLPLSRDPRSTGEEEALVMTLQQLAEFLGKLLGQCIDASKHNSLMDADVAEFHLSGLLAWIVQHPGRSHYDAAELAVGPLLVQP